MVLLGLFHNLFVRVFPPGMAEQAVTVHYPPDLFMVHGNVMVVFKIHLYAAPAKFLLTLVEYAFNQQEVFIISGLLPSLFEPFVVSGF